jgi:hypothetical protein
VDRLCESLDYVRLESCSAREELTIFLCCILGDIATETIDSVRPTDELRVRVLDEKILYDRLASTYAVSLQQPIHHVEYCIGEDLLKLAALKALAHSTTDSWLSINNYSPPICRVVCIFLGGLGLSLLMCKHRTERKRLVEWSLAPAFYTAVSWGLDALRVQLSEQTYDMLVLAPVALIAIRQLKDGLNGFSELERSAEPQLQELINKCELTALDVIRAAKDTLRSAEKIESFLDAETMVWVEKIVLVR